MYIRCQARLSMGDAAAAPERTQHKYHYTSALDIPKVNLLEGNGVIQQHILNDLKFRIREVEDLKVEVDRLKGLNVAQGIAALTVNGSAAPVMDTDALRCIPCPWIQDKGLPVPVHRYVHDVTHDL